MTWAWVAVWLLVALATSVNTVVNGSAALAGEISGSRTTGLVLLTPLMALFLAGCCVAIAVKTAPVNTPATEEGSLAALLSEVRLDALKEVSYDFSSSTGSWASGHMSE